MSAGTKGHNKKKTSIRSGDVSLNLKTYFDSDSALPVNVKGKLNDLFSQIAREFEILYAENTSLQERVDLLTEKLLEKESIGDKQIDPNDAESKLPLTGKSKVIQKSKTAHKLKAQTSKIVSSFKGPAVNCAVLKEFVGHKDGIWDVATARPGQPLIGTASADHSAWVWSVESGRCLLQYQGHTGSVNSIRFHPSKDLILTGSGDHTAHVWQAVVNWESIKVHSSDEDAAQQTDDYPAEEYTRSLSLRTPVKELTGHSGVVAAADWLPGGDQLITASWDRTACLHDLETGELLQSLGGHDFELTHVSAHPSQCLVVTSSKDTTFRLWDFREPIHSVSVFQGHTDTVRSAVFTKEDKVVSGSDDRCVKVWDLRNMRSPFATITADSAVNRIGVSANGVIAIPHDNRQVRLFDLNGQRIVRLPLSNRQGHRRMVTSVAWTGEEPSTSTCNLFSCGFDRVVIGWSVQLSTSGHSS